MGLLSWMKVPIVLMQISRTNILKILERHLNADKKNSSICSLFLSLHYMVSSKSTSSPSDKCKILTDNSVLICSDLVNYCYIF